MNENDLSDEAAKEFAALTITMKSAQLDATYQAYVNGVRKGCSEWRRRHEAIVEELRKNPWALFEDDLFLKQLKFIVEQYGFVAWREKASKEIKAELARRDTKEAK